MSRLDVRCLDDEPSIRRHDQLVRVAPAGTVFGTAAWLDYIGVEKRVYGVYKGDEHIAGLCVPVSGGRVLRVVPQTPWTGLCARSDHEGENLAIAEAVAGHLLREFGDVTLTLPPDWIDLRGFIWQGMRTHVRYTYTGNAARMLERYEKRLTLRECNVKRAVIHRGDGWEHVRFTCADTVVDAIHQQPWWYYWQANRGGSWHAEIIDEMLRLMRLSDEALDMVGCNSPQRGLFKRQFGGRLVPYYVVTTADPRDIAEFWPPQEAKVA